MAKGMLQAVKIVISQIIGKVPQKAERQRKAGILLAFL
jgi:hypothetical protein